MKCLCCLLLSFLFATSSNGQVKTKQPVVNKTKTIPAGQPKIKKPTGRRQDDNIYSALQDKAGNLWFCSTGEGVYRYDGKLFTNFTEKDGLSSNVVWSVLEDKAGNIWFGTDSGICRYDPSATFRTGSKTFVAIPIIVSNSGSVYYYTSPNNNPPTNNVIWSMMQDKSGKMWFGTRDNGVYCYNGKSFTHFLDNDGVINKDNLHLKWVDCILEDRAGNIWFASGPLSPNGVYRYDGTSITAFNPKGDKWVRSIIEDKNGNLLFVTRHQGACRFDGKGFTNFTDKGGLDRWSVTSVLEDKAGNLWFGEDRGNSKGEYAGGLWRFDGKTYSRFTTKEGLSNNGVWCIIQDRAGNIWAGSRCNGLSRYDGNTFTNFTE